MQLDAKRPSQGQTDNNRPVCVDQSRIIVAIALQIASALHAAV